MKIMFIIAITNIAIAIVSGIITLQDIGVNNE
jgi:cytochrome b subunit of formate dehydrogenase